MKPPLFVRTLTDDERAALKAGLRSPDAFALRRCQVFTASADGVWPATIAARLGCASQSVRDAIRAFSDETIRQALLRLGCGWKRAKTWITSPDPAYLGKKRLGTDCFV